MHFDVIDDEAVIRSLMRDVIALEGYHVKTFASADDYLAYFESPGYVQPIAILSDVLMPGTSGISLVRHIHERCPEQKMVLISGRPSDASEADGQVCAIIAKPFHPERVIDMLRALKRCHECGPCRQSGRLCAYGLDHSCPMQEQKEAKGGT